MTDSRSIPQAVEAEKSVLSLMTVDPSLYVGKAITHGCHEGYFYLPGHRILWSLFQDRYNANLPLDIVSIQQILQDRQQLDSVGGISGLAEIFSYSTTGAWFDTHLTLLRDKYVLRTIIATSDDAIARAFDADGDVSALLDSVESSIFKIREGIDKGTDKTLAKMIDEAVDRLEEMLQRKGDIAGISTGFPLLDSMGNGLKPGDMFVVAARPSMGKTAFLLNVLEHVALDLGKRSLLFSCEMPSVQIVERLLFARSKVQRSEIIKARGLTKLQMEAIRRVVGDLKNSRLVIDDTPAISINELRAKARRAMRDMGGLDVIGIDYLQLMRSHSKQAQNSREREIAEISAGLKALAKELNVPIIVLAQLNRGPENRTGKSKGVPQMSDLRESGAIEQDADMIGLLYRSAYYAEDEDERQKSGDRANLYLAKNRNGPTGDVPLSFTAGLMRFSQRERDDQDPT